MLALVNSESRPSEFTGTTTPTLVDLPALNMICGAEGRAPTPDHILMEPEFSGFRTCTITTTAVAVPLLGTPVASAALICFVLPMSIRLPVRMSATRFGATGTNRPPATA